MGALALVNNHRFRNWGVVEQVLGRGGVLTEQVLGRRGVLTVDFV